MKKVLTLSQARDSATFWKLAKDFQGNFRTRKHLVEADVFKQHFESWLNPEVEPIYYQTVSQLIEIEELDCDFTITELEGMLQNSKDGKAAGFNRIAGSV